MLRAKVHLGGVSATGDHMIGLIDVRYEWQLLCPISEQRFPRPLVGRRGDIQGSVCSGQGNRAVMSMGV